MNEMFASKFAAFGWNFYPISQVEHSPLTSSEELGIRFRDPEEGAKLHRLLSVVPPT
jgi:hypothetical protein